MWEDDEEYTNDETGWPSTDDIRRSEEEAERSREKRKRESAQAYNQRMRRDLLSCLSGGFPSGEMAAMSFLQGGFPDDDGDLML